MQVAFSKTCKFMWWLSFLPNPLSLLLSYSWILLKVKFQRNSHLRRKSVNGPNKFTIFSKGHSVVCGFDILILFAQRERERDQKCRIKVPLFPISFPTTITTTTTLRITNQFKVGGVKKKFSLCLSFVVVLFWSRVSLCTSGWSEFNI